MKTIPTPWPVRRAALTRLTRLLLPIALLLAAQARASLPEPDNILYGTIVISDIPVTAARTDVVIEARRSPTGPAIASYRMGTLSDLGSLYRLVIPIEAFGPAADPNASLAGDTLYIVLRDASGVQGQTAYTIPERGVAQQVNFGVAVPDVDGNGLPDVWEIAHLGGTGQDPDSDEDGDGQSNRNEWIAGTDPLNGNDAFRVAVQQAAGQTEVAFVALRAEGPGYEGLTRYYSLHSNTNLAPGVWPGLSGYTNLTGNGQTVTYRPPGPETNPPTFYRGVVRLE